MSLFEIIIEKLSVSLNYSFNKQKMMIYIINIILLKIYTM